MGPRVRGDDVERLLPNPLAQFVARMERSEIRGLVRSFVPGLRFAHPGYALHPGYVQWLVAINS